MKRRPRQFQQSARDDFAVPGFLHIGGPSNRDGKSMHMIVGFGAGGVAVCYARTAVGDAGGQLPRQPIAG
jgi:hypothetical protein